MAHSHSVLDTDALFSIDAITRLITNEMPKRKRTIVQKDHNSERFTFTLPRYIEGHDMTQCNRVEVHYINAGTNAKEQASGLYVVDDLEVSENDEEKVVCSWLISRNATQYAGKLAFLLRFMCLNDSIVEYAWNTAPHTDIYITAGIDASEMFEKEYVEIIDRWKASVMAHFTDAIGEELTAWEEKTGAEVRAEAFADIDKQRERIDLLSNYVTPQMFGAKGDGVTDDTEAIQAALDAVGKNANGGTLRLSGSFVISSPLLYKSNTYLLADGAELRYSGFATVVDKVMLKPYGGGVENVVIEGVTFDHKGDLYGNNGTSPCVSVNRVKNVTIKNCVFRNVQTMAVWLDDGEGDTENVRIIDNTIENGRAGGISLFGYVDGLIINGNNIKNLHDDAIALQPGTQVKTMHPINAVISNNVIENCIYSSASGSTPRGIISYSAENVNIQGNVIKDSLSCNIAVWCEAAADDVDPKDLNVIISGNVCLNAGCGRTNTATPADGIRVVGYDKVVRHVVVSDNIVGGSADNGIYLVGALFDVDHNTIKEVGQSGIMMMASEDCIIDGNIIENAGVSGTNSVGVYLAGTSLRNIISNNRVFGENTLRGVLLQAKATNNRVSGNNFKGVITSAVYDLGANNDICGNVTKSGYPLQIDYTIPAATSDFALTNISAVQGCSVLVYPCNKAARLLLQQGFYVNTYDEQVDIHTEKAAEGGEKIRVKVL